MGALVALFCAGFRHQSTLRLALVSGVLTNSFFGVVRTAVFLAVYASADLVGGIDVQHAVTYVWVLQSVFGMIWSPWQHELPARIRSGEFTAELTRPGNLLHRHLAYDFGRACFVLCFRAPIPLALAAIAFDLRVPTTVAAGLLAIVSLLFAAAASTLFRYLIGSIAYWSPDYRGIASLLFGPIWLAGGFVIPLDYFPGALADIAALGPLASLLHAPVSVVTGSDVVGGIALQVVWLGLGMVAATVVTRRALDRMVVLGG